MKKKRKGEKIRPCPRCSTPVRFLKSAWVETQKQRQGWHWVNQDGSHHRCSDFVETGVDMLANDWQAAMERDIGPYDAERASAK